MRKAEEIIREAESKWYEPLYRHCAELFSGTFLPSHDHLHHARVWSYARELLLRLYRQDRQFPDHTAEALLVAVFFHDAGLSRNSGERHGRESRRLCEEYFSPSGPPAPIRSSWPHILYAIEHHDDKSLKTDNRPAERVNAHELLALLGPADDLDAFGYIGIYRYAEIYLMRGVEPERLPGKVIENVRNRWANLRNTYGHMEDYMEIQAGRYEQVCEFYLRLARAYAAGLESPSWEPALIGMIGEGIRQRKNLLERDRELPATGFDGEIQSWFGKLDMELQFRRSTLI